MTRDYLAFTDTGLALASVWPPPCPAALPGAGRMVFLLQNGQARSLCSRMR